MSPSKDQLEWNKWLKVKEIVGAENAHAIALACEMAAAQYRKDERLMCQTGQERVEQQFRSQAERCENIQKWLQL